MFIFFIAPHLQKSWCSSNKSSRETRRAPSLKEGAPHCAAHKKPETRDRNAFKIQKLNQASQHHWKLLSPPKSAVRLRCASLLRSSPSIPGFQSKPWVLCAFAHRERSVSLPTFASLYLFLSSHHCVARSSIHKGFKRAYGSQSRAVFPFSTLALHVLLTRVSDQATCAGNLLVFSLPGAHIVLTALQTVSTSTRNSLAIRRHPSPYYIISRFLPARIERDTRLVDGLSVSLADTRSNSFPLVSLHASVLLQACR